MSSLKDQLIRLGNQKPELRKHLKPILKRISRDKSSSDQIIRKVEDFLNSKSDVFRVDEPLVDSEKILITAFNQSDPMDFDFQSKSQINTDGWERILDRKLSGVKDISVHQMWNDFEDANEVTITVWI